MRIHLLGRPPLLGGAVRSIILTMRRERVSIPASAIGLAVCVSLLAAPPASMGAAAAVPDAATRLAPTRRGVHELVENLREAVRRLRVTPTLARHVTPPRPASAVHDPQRPRPACDQTASPPLCSALARLLNLPPPAAA